MPNTIFVSRRKNHCSILIRGRDAGRLLIELLTEIPNEYITLALGSARISIDTNGKDYLAAWLHRVRAYASVLAPIRMLELGDDVQSAELREDAA